MDRKNIRMKCAAALACIAPVDCVLAAAVAAAAPDGLHFEWGTALLSFVICTLSGVASLLQRVSKELSANPDKPLAHPYLFVATNMAGSWAAGALAYALGQMMHWGVWECLVSMIIASYAGAAFLESVYAARMPRMTGTVP
jgi:hypothetical protein